MTSIPRVKPLGIPNRRCYKMASSVFKELHFTSSKKYPKRPGTSGIQGHLYETKLLSLIYFRALHNDNIQDFHLATNVDQLGSFDDICFRVKVKGIEKPLTVFMQAKHRENNTVLTLNSKSDLIKHFNSYLEIRNKFKTNNEDVLFDGTYRDTECLFVIYTTAKDDDSARKYKNDNATFLNAIIGTENLGSNLQPLDDSKRAELLQLLLEEEMTALARLMVKCMHGEFKDVQMLNLEDVVLRYHVILAQQIFDVSNDQSEGLRDARLRQDFFDINEELAQIFIEKLCTEMNRRNFLSDTCSNLPNQKINHFITYENRKFEVVDKIGSARCKVSYLDKINESPDTEQEILELDIKQSLPTFKVPAWFGNKDLTIRGSDKKIERKLIDLTSNIIKLIERSRPSNIIIIRKSLGEGFLQLSGGIASAVGNLIVFDDVSKLLKFNDNRESLGKLAKTLLDHLNSKIENLYEYRFDVRVKIFPKLTFNADKYTKNIVRDFSKKLLFYTSQAKEVKVEAILINEIKKKLLRHDDIYINDTNATSNTIFVKYHDAIQKWWMKKEGEYLTKEKNLYENAEKHALGQSLTSFVNMMHRINIKGYAFTEDAVNSIKLDDQPSGTVILTKNIRLTVAKLVNNLIKNDCVVLDMQYVLDLSKQDIEILQKELIDLNKENIVIVACDKAIFDTKYKKELTNITMSLRSKTVIIILDDQDFVEKAKEHFVTKDTVINDERNNLIDMSKESQKSILENTNVLFHGVGVNLDQVLDDKSLVLVEELALYKLMQSDKCIIGKPASHSNDKEKIYIERSVKCFKVVPLPLDAKHKTIMKISTLHDLENDIVLVFGDPGMGKSTLLTQLTLKTQHLSPTDWIVRINLLEYSKQLFIWQDNKTVIDTLTSLTFLCQVVLSEESIKKRDRIEITLEDRDGTVFLKDCDGDEWTIFQLKLFLHYYNTKTLIILFDGFDEICPTYAREAFSLIKAVMNLHRKHKIWLTSRSYHKVVSELNLNVFYKLESLNNDEQNMYLSAFWKEKNLLQKMNNESSVRNNIGRFSNSMHKIESEELKKQVSLPNESLNEKPMLAVYLSLHKYLQLSFKDLYNELSPRYGGLVTNPFYLNMLAEHLYNKIFVNSDDSLSTSRNSKIEMKENYTARQNFKTKFWSDVGKISSDIDMRKRINSSPIEWNLDVNLFEVYERFLEYKLKIRFQEKNQTDIYRPDNIAQYRRAKTDSKDKLQHLAAYVVYNNRLLDKHELKYCEKIINQLKHEEENTDVICNVVNDIPIFVHSTFADYFAVEYICQVIKEQHNLGNSLENIFNFILNVMFFELNKNVLVILDAKINVDEKLRSIIDENKKVIATLLLNQSKIVENEHGGIKSSLCEAIRLDLKNLAVLLLSTTEILVDDVQLTNFVNIVRISNILMIAVKMGFNKFLISLIDNIRMINESKLNELFQNIEIFDKNKNFEGITTEELVQKLHANVWTRMDIVPDWENLKEFFWDSIQFI